MGSKNKQSWGLRRIREHVRELGPRALQGIIEG